ncbi:MAG TPA: thiamine-phosphate kinase [Flavobacteriales bacterium]|nr:thiamine-phosphate kinase [Flavobacteriales bacterium]HRE73479.1 thiamine-phosphate kinase [Flavobacteriales bacterium]HRE95501.1 thiamine-phosphate kinase [Flavobacteriales bacterium]HRJ36765.1 thiamine-phosphate kinase [Flavobacteriales bacterium]HRJ38972.1 thiamine-phosphate kinase [Flavobacteriales bacterium]
MFENKENRTELSELGEFGLIDHLAKHIGLSHPSTLKGIGDDAAVIDQGNGQVTLVTTDMLTEGVHFDLGYVPLKHLGYKAISVNLSDICAMNGRPAQVVVGLGLSNRFSLEAVEELYAGMKLACERYNVDLVGGDTTTSRAGLVLSITAIGTAAKNKVAYRSGAQENDIIILSGDLGGAYMGLQLLEREKEVFKANPSAQPDLEGFDYILERQLKPEPRLDIVELLDSLGIIPTSMIDVSDGLASEILHICKQSGYGADLYIEKIPLDPMTISTADAFNLEPVTCGMSGGEDYELLFTIKASDFEKLQNNPLITPIGHITGKGERARLITPQKEAIEITAQGWKHF